MLNYVKCMAFFGVFAAFCLQTQHVHAQFFKQFACPAFGNDCGEPIWDPSSPPPQGVATSLKMSVSRPIAGLISATFSITLNANNTFVDTRIDWDIIDAEFGNTPSYGNAYISRQLQVVQNCNARNLIPGRRYYVSLSIKGKLISNTAMSFQTLSCGEVIPLSPVVNANKRVTLSWLNGASSGTLTHKVEYRKVGTTSWNSVTVATKSYVTPALVAGTYDWRVTTECRNTIIDRFSRSSNGKRFVIRAAAANAEPELATNSPEFELNPRVDGIERTLTLYPNPATDVLNIQLTDAAESIKSIQIMNVTGQAVMIMNGQNPKSFDVNSLNKGLYFYNIRTDLKTYSGKFFKE